MNDASRNLGITHQSISAACRCKRKTAGQYVWRYEGDSFDT